MSRKILDQLLKKPNPKAKYQFNHYNVDKPNYEHQIDILFLPYSKEHPNRYCLCLVDVASRYKAAVPLKTKDSKEVFKAWISLIKKPLTFPKVLNSDQGSEFAQIKTYCSKNNILYKQNEPGYHTSLVEAMNGNLSRLIFHRQYQKELDTGKPNVEWADTLQKDISVMNNTKTALIKMKPVDAIKLDVVEQPENKFTKKDFSKHYPVGTSVRYLLQNDQILDLASGKITIGKRRKTDAYWSLKTYQVTELQESPESLAMHKITEIDDGVIGDSIPHMFTYWQLQKI